MSTIVFFFIKSIVLCGILFAYYWLVLRNKSFHQYNRLYLLLAMVIPVAIPFLNFKLFSFEQSLPFGLNNLSQKIISNSAIQPHSLFTWQSGLYVTLISISLIMLFILFSKIYWIFKIKKCHAIIKMDGFNLIETELKQAPFCFLNNLFWRKSISMFDDNGEKIFAHELTHIQERHTYDKLFSQIMLCFFWINPFYWFIQKELNVIHEFIADSKSIKDGDTESFAKMLLQSHNEGRYLNPSHSFFHSSIKRRLIMITTSKNTQYSYLRRVLVLPITLLVFIVFSCTKTAPKTTVDSTKMLVNKESTITTMANVQFKKEDGTTGSKFMTVNYSVVAPNSSQEKISPKNSTISANVKFVKKDGTTGSLIMPVKHSISGHIE